MNEELNELAKDQPSPFVSFLSSIKIEKIDNILEEKSNWNVLSTFEVVDAQNSGLGQSRLMGLHITESMFTPFISGHIDVMDKHDWIAQMNLNGSEKITIKFSFIDSLEPLTLEFFVFSARIINDFAGVNSPKIETGEKATIYRLEFLSDEIFNANFNKSILELDKDFIGLIAKGGNGGAGSGAVQNLNTVPGLIETIATKLKLEPIEIEGTKNGIWLKSDEISYPSGIQQGQINIANLMSYVTNNAVPKENTKAANFFFWKDRDGWHFKSVEKIIKESEESDELVTFEMNTDNLQNKYRILSVEVDKLSDKLSMFQDSAFMSHYIKMEPNYENLYSDFLSSKAGFTYSTVDYDYHRDFPLVKHIEKYKLIPDQVPTNPVKILSGDNKKIPMPATRLRDNTFGYYKTNILNTPFEYNIHHSSDVGFGSKPDNPNFVWWDYLDRERDSRWSNVAWQPQFDITELEIQKLYTIYTKIRQPLEEKRKEFVKLKNLKREWEVYRCVVCCATNSIGSTADVKLFNDPSGITNPDEFKMLFGNDGIFGGEQEYKIVAAGSFTDTINYDSAFSEIQHGLSLAINVNNPSFMLPQGVNGEDYKPNEWYKSSIGQFFNLNDTITSYTQGVMSRGLGQYEFEKQVLNTKLTNAKTFLEKVPDYIEKANQWIESRLLDCCNKLESTASEEIQTFTSSLADDVDYSALCSILPSPSGQVIFATDPSNFYDYFSNSYSGEFAGGNGEILQYPDSNFDATGRCSVEAWGYQSSTNGSRIYKNYGDPINPFGSYYYYGYYDSFNAPFSEIEYWIRHIRSGNETGYDDDSDTTVYKYQKCRNTEVVKYIDYYNEFYWSNSKYNGLSIDEAPEIDAQQITSLGGILLPRRCTGAAVRNAFISISFGMFNFVPCGVESVLLSDIEASRALNYDGYIYGLAGQNGTQSVVPYTFPMGGFYCFGDPRKQENQTSTADKWFAYDQTWCQQCRWQTDNFTDSQSQCYLVDKWMTEIYGVSGADAPSEEIFLWESFRKKLEDKINQDTQSSCGRYIVQPLSRLIFSTIGEGIDTGTDTSLPIFNQSQSLLSTVLGRCAMRKTRALVPRSEPTVRQDTSPGPCSDDPSFYSVTGKPCDYEYDTNDAYWNVGYEIYGSSSSVERYMSCAECGYVGGLWLPLFSVQKVLTSVEGETSCQPGGPACLNKGCTDTLTGSVFSREPSACVGFNYVDGLGEIPLIVLPPNKCIKCNNFLESENDKEFDKSNCCNCSPEQEKSFINYKTDEKLAWCRECSKDQFVNLLPQYIGSEDNWYNSYGYIPGGGSGFTDLDEYIGLNSNLQVTRQCLQDDNCYNKLCFNPLYLEAEARRAKQEIKILEAQIKLLDYTKNIVQQGLVSQFNTLYEEWWNRKAFFYSKIPGKNVFTDVSTGITGSIEGGRTGPVISDLSLFNIKSIKKKSIRGSRYELLAKNKGITGAQIGEWLYNFAWNIPAQDEPVSTQPNTKHPYYSQKYQSNFISQRQVFKNYNYSNYNKFNDFPFGEYVEQPYAPDEKLCFNIINAESTIISLPETQVSLIDNIELEVNEQLQFTQNDLSQGIDPVNYHNTFNIFNINENSIPANLKKEQLSTYVRIEFETPIGLDRIIDFPDGFVRDAGTEYFLPYLVSLTAGPTGRQTIRNNVVVIGMDPYGFDVAVKKSPISDEETDKQQHWWDEYRNLNDTSLTNNGMDLWPEVGFETNYPYYASDPKGWWWKSSWYHGEGTPDLKLENTNSYDIFSRSADVDPEYKESAHGSGYLQYSYRKVKPHRSWWSFHIPKNIFIPQKLFPILAKKFGSMTGSSSGVLGDIYAYKYQDYYWWYGDDLDRWLRLTEDGKNLAEGIKMLSVRSAEFGGTEPLSNYAHVHNEDSLDLVGGAVEKYFYETTLHWLRGDFVMYKPGLLTEDVWKYDLTGETEYGLVSPKTMAPNYDVFDDNFSAQFIVFSRDTKNLCKTFTCANPNGTVSNSICPPNDPYCLCPAKDRMPKENEPSYLELYRKYKEIKECELIKKNLGEQYLGCIWSDPSNPCSCNCPEVGEKFVDYLKYTRTYATFWDTPRATPLIRKALMTQLASQQISVQIPATSKVKIGNIIQINHYAGINLSFERQEKNLHGKWLVAEIVNSFYKDANQSMRMTLIRDSSPVEPDYTYSIIRDLLGGAGFLI